MRRLTLAVAIVLVIAACSTQPGAMPTPEISPTPAPSPSVAVIASPVVSPPPSASMTADAATALDVAGSYEAARADGEWSAAWAFLSERSQTTIGSLASFESEETAYNAQGGTVFSLQAPTQDADLVVSFLGASQPAIAQEADTDRGYLIFVLHPDVQAASAGTTGLYVAPLRSGDWRIWLVH